VLKRARLLTRPQYEKFFSILFFEVSIFKFLVLPVFICSLRIFCNCLSRGIWVMSKRSFWTISIRHLMAIKTESNWRERTLKKISDQIEKYLQPNRDGKKIRDIYIFFWRERERRRFLSHSQFNLNSLG